MDRLNLKLHFGFHSLSSRQHATPPYDPLNYNEVDDPTKERDHWIAFAEDERRDLDDSQSNT